MPGSLEINTISLIANQGEPKVFFSLTVQISHNTY